MTGKVDDKLEKIEKANMKMNQPPYNKQLIY